MSSTTQRSQALLRIFSLVAATLLFIAMNEQDAKHDDRQRWLAETRRRQEATMLADHEPERSRMLVEGYTHGSHGSTFPRVGNALRGVSDDGITLR